MGVWNVVSAVCLIIILAVVLAAAIRWWLGSYRSVGAHLELTTLEGDKRTLIRIQNMGATGCNLLGVYAKNATIRRADNLPEERVIGPCGSILYESTDWNRESRIVTIHVDHARPGRACATSFGYMTPHVNNEGYDIGLLEHPLPCNWRKLKYREKDGRLFLGSGVTDRHKWIRLEPRKENRPLTSFINRLVTVLGFESMMEFGTPSDR